MTRPNALCFIALAGFSICLIAMHRLVFLYHDDWGIATLLYGVETHTGNDGGLWSYLWNRYLTWTGRIGAYLAQIGVMSFGLGAVRSVQVAVLLAVPVFAALCLPAHRRPVGIAVAALYVLSMPVMLGPSGLYWFSASVAYVWGSVLFSIGVGLHCVHGRRLAGWMLVALSATFHEQLATATLALIVVDALRIGPRLRHALAGCLTLVVLLSPGNFRRREVWAEPDSGLWQVIHNAEALGALVLSRGALPWLTWLCLAALVFARCPPPRREAHFVLASLIAAASTLVPALAAPNPAPRMLLPAFFILAVPVAVVIARMRHAMVAVIVLAIPSMLPAARLYTGFAANFEANRHNHETLLVADATAGELTLLRLPEPRFKEAMPYDRAIVAGWMLTFYDLPSDTALNWVEGHRATDLLAKRSLE